MADLRKVQAVGDSLGMTLSKDALATLDAGKGTMLIVEKDDDELTVRKAPSAVQDD